MLVLTRRKDESIVIAGNIVVTVVSVDGGKVRLGIEAPSDISVHRSEVHESICKGHEEAKRGEFADPPTVNKDSKET